MAAKGTTIFNRSHYPCITKMCIEKNIKEDDVIKSMQNIEGVLIKDNEIPSKSTQIRNFYDLAQVLHHVFIEHRDML